MGFIRFLIWTAMCIGLGVFIGTWEIDGKTPAMHLKQMWKGAPPQLKKLAAPTETHSDEDREAINRIVAKRK